MRCAAAEMEREEVLISPTATQFAKMEITNSEVMRVTRAHQAFQRFAGPLRPKNFDDFYRDSFVSKRISSFWSHSWHGDYRKKVLTLLLIHNGRAAVAVGCFTAMTMMVLFSFGVLPGWVRNPDLNYLLWSTWASGGGFMATTMTFLFWRSQRLVFLDRICINQHDDTLKKDSIYSLGGIIRQSQEMLVLWDSTWSDRLWCQFEFAAFLSKKAGEQVLLIAPTFLGPCSCVLFIGISIFMVPMTTLPVGNAPFSLLLVGLVGLVSAYFIVAALRGYFRTVDALKEKISSFNFDNSRSACCDIDHISRGRKIMCDRQIVNECVSIWFGNQETFEDYVRSKVLENVRTQLETRVFTRSWSLSVTTPLLWFACDLSATRFRVGEYELAIVFILLGFVSWFLCGPILIDSSTYLARRFSGKPTSMACEVMKNMAVLMLLMMVLCAISGTMSFVIVVNKINWGSHLQRFGVFTAFWSVIAVSHLSMKFIVSRRRAGSDGISAGTI